jgi:RND family efflux transporter MFP subunit
MRRKVWLILIVVITLAAAGLYVSTRGPWPFGTESFETAGTYYCPMHPQHRADEPGNCPICSMKLVPLEKLEAGAAPAGQPAQAIPGMDAAPSTQPAPEGPATIFIAPERQQLIGVKSASAELRSLVREIRTVGRVAYDETKITHIHTKVSGFIEEVFVDYVGKSVRRGEPLFSIYSPDLVATQEEYLLALKSNALLKDSAFPWVSGGSDNLLKAARQRLLSWDITPSEIEELERLGRAKRALTIHSPVDGIVTERQAYHHGRYVTPDLDLYTIVDLSRIWVLGEIYESDLPLLKIGQVAEIELPYSANVNRRRGRIVFISPALDPQTRTVEVRVEFSNADLALKPDMFVNFRLNIPLGRRLVVPADAVLDTGTLQYVFVDKGQGYFEPRAVTVGARTEDVYAIESGLKAGERVVTAANFILDSESRLKGVFAAMGEPSRVAIGGPPAGAQNLNVEVLEPKVAKTGNNTIRLSLKDPTGKPIEDAEVEVTLFMPQMGNMPPMTSKAQLRHEGGGVYSGMIQVLMAWTWETTVTVRKEGQVLGSAKTTITAR